MEGTSTYSQLFSWPVKTSSLSVSQILIVTENYSHVQSHHKNKAIKGLDLIPYPQNLQNVHLVYR